MLSAINISIRYGSLKAWRRPCLVNPTTRPGDPVISAVEPRIGQRSTAPDSAQVVSTASPPPSPPEIQTSTEITTVIEREIVTVVTKTSIEKTSTKTSTRMTRTAIADDQSSGSEKRAASPLPADSQAEAMGGDSALPSIYAHAGEAEPLDACPSSKLNRAESRRAVSDSIKGSMGQVALRRSNRAARHQAMMQVHAAHQQARQSQPTKAARDILRNTLAYKAGVSLCRLCEQLRDVCKEEHTIIGMVVPPQDEEALTPAQTIQARRQSRYIFEPFPFSCDLSLTAAALQHRRRTRHQPHVRPPTF